LTQKLKKPSLKNLAHRFFWAVRWRSSAHRIFHGSAICTIFAPEIDQMLQK
jgi:hypothetical protein